MIKAVLFDLDGTLLPMDQDEFTNGYFKFLVKKLAPHGYEPEALIKAIWHGTAAMVKNDGSRTNEEAFWADFANTCGERVLSDAPIFEEFYAVEFLNAKSFCGYDENAAKTVRFLKDAGIRIVLATNPIFPDVATRARIGWAGLEPEDFEFYTTYETIGCCKPNPEYYAEILRRLELEPQDCVMVGNDVGEDMIAEKLGMRVFLLTDCIINKANEDISRFAHGGYAELMDYLKKEME